MTPSENRRFPRIPHVSSRRIVHVDSGQNPQRNLILTENLSASGIKFTTNSKMNAAQFFLIYLNDMLVHEIDALHNHRGRWVRSGDHYLTRVIWVNEIDKTNGISEIGAAFVEKEGCREEELHTLTELMNVNILERLPQRSSANY